jgi:molecular chaperone DnaJ
MGLSVTFKEALEGAEKRVSFVREVKCRTCKGTKEAQGSKSSQCYSCKGEGVKSDPLFKKETKCNTCGGHGTLIVNPCKPCKGQGVVEETAEKLIKIAKFTENDSTLQFEHEGHHSLFLEKGEDGHLIIKVTVERDSQMRRDGLNIISKHYITLADAILGCEVTVDTVSGAHKI